MSKGLKILVSILYYAFTFIIGLFIAITLPNIYYYDMTMSSIRDSLNSKEYSQAMELVGGYFDKEYCYQVDFTEGGGIVLFKSATLDYVKDEDGNDTNENFLQKSYAGFIYGISDSYNCKGKDDNKTKLILIDKNDVEYKIDLLDYDSDEDEIIDTISTLYEKGFIYVDLNINIASSIKEIKFIDASGNIFKEFELNYEFNEQFFTDVNPFITKYNEDPRAQELEQLDNEFRQKSSNYLMSSNDEISSKAQKKSITFVIIYFVVIYIIADFLIGKRLILKFIKWILVKVFKVKFKDKAQKSAEEEFSGDFGHDYYSQLTMKLEFDGDSDLDEVVVISYSNIEENFEFNLLKSENYTQTKRVKAGLYMNPRIELNANYEAQNLPENLVVQGFRTNVTINIKRIEKREE